jgi:hypothetical protein
MLANELWLLSGSGNFKSLVFNTPHEAFEHAIKEARTYFTIRLVYQPTGAPVVGSVTAVGSGTAPTVSTNPFDL